MHLAQLLIYIYSFSSFSVCLYLISHSNPTPSHPSLVSPFSQSLPLLIEAHLMSHLCVQPCLRSCPHVLAPLSSLALHPSTFQSPSPTPFIAKTRQPTNIVELSSLPISHPSSHQTPYPLRGLTLQAHQPPNPSSRHTILLAPRLPKAPSSHQALQPSTPPTVLSYSLMYIKLPKPTAIPPHYI